MELTSRSHGLGKRGCMKILEERKLVRITGDFFAGPRLAAGFTRRLSGTIDPRQRSGAGQGWRGWAGRAGPTSIECVFQARLKQKHADAASTCCRTARRSAFSAHAGCLPTLHCRDLILPPCSRGVLRSRCRRVLIRSS